MNIDKINELLDKEIEFAKGCGMPQFVMGILQAKKVLNNNEVVAGNKRSLFDIYEEVRQVLKENNCHIRSEMGHEDTEGFAYLIRKQDEVIEKVKFEDTFLKEL